MTEDDEEEIYDDERTWEDLLAGALAPGDVLSEKYRVDELIGYGAMGFVLKAWHLQLDEPVAVKFLLPELAASEEALVRFEREARATFKIKSEHVVRVLDVGRLEEGHPFMVMEYLEGEELADQIYEGEMPIGKITDIVLQACAAVAEAHAHGIIHRDVKPDNLFLTRRRDGTTCVKVLDFGLSKFLPRPSQAGTTKRQRAVTAEAQVMGTAHYMSPEQWISAKDVGPATDIWSLGVILYEGLTGESPFMRNNLAAMCNAVLREDPPPILELRPDVPEGLVAIVDRCLAKEVTMRFSSVSEVGEALRTYASTPSLLPTFPAPASDPPRGSAPTMTEVMSQPRIVASDTAAGGVAALPRLGLRHEGGFVETWADVLAEGPPRPSNRMFVVLGLVAAVIVMGLSLAMIF